MCGFRDRNVRRVKYAKSARVNHRAKRRPFNIVILLVVDTYVRRRDPGGIYGITRWNATASFIRLTDRDGAAVNT